MSECVFYRWKCIRENSWAFSTFKKHNKELWSMYMSFEMTVKFAYSQFKGEPKSTWQRPVKDFFQTEAPLKPYISPYFIKIYNVKNWSDSLSDFRNWINLNTLLILSANLETYIAKITRLALLSDFGLLFGYEKQIDGIHILKYSSDKSKLDDLIDTQVVNFTKGDWQSRINNLCNIFKNLDKELLVSNLNELEKMRKIRNDLAHSFGRDIDMIQKNLTLKAHQPIKQINRRTILKYDNLIYKIVKHIDSTLMESIGNYEALHAYHDMYHSIFSERQKNEHIHVRAYVFRKKYGELGRVHKNSKQFSRELAKFYENQLVAKQVR